MKYEQAESIILSIQGFLIPGQEKFLFDLASSLPENAVVVEVGSYMGRSSAALALALDKPGQILHCIDPWPYSLAERAWDQNLLGLPVVKHKGTSREILTNWNQPIDLIFLDGSHAFNDVYDDVRLSAPWIKPNGKIALHDVIDNWPGCKMMWDIHLAPNVTRIENSSSLYVGTVSIPFSLPKL